MASPAFILTATATGPLFKPGLAEKVMRDTMRDYLQNTAEAGEAMVAGQLQSGHGVVTGNLRRSIIGEVGTGIGRGRGGAKKVNATSKARALRGIPKDHRHAVIYDSGVVYGPWIEGVGTRNAASRFKGYAMFRKARTALERGKRQRIERHLRRNLRRLN